MEVQFKQVKSLQPVIQVSDGIKGPLVCTRGSAIVCFIQAFEAIREVGNKVTAKGGVVNVICRASHMKFVICISNSVYPHQKI